MIDPRLKTKRNKPATQPRPMGKLDASFGALLVACGMLLGCVGTFWAVELALKIQQAG